MTGVAILMIEERLAPIIGRPGGNLALHLLHRGELLSPLESKQTLLNDSAKYFVKNDPSTNLFCMPDDVAPLDHHESWLLEGIESASERFEWFSEGKKLEWGPTLAVNDTVYASIPGLKPVVRRCSTAIIRYIGQVKGFSGCQFGIEIMVRFSISRNLFAFCFSNLVSVVYRMVFIVELVQVMGPLTVIVTFSAKRSVVSLSPLTNSLLWVSKVGVQAIPS